MDESTIKAIADAVFQLWTATAQTAGIICVFNIPIILFFVCHRAVEIHRRDMSGNPALPVHQALHYFAAIYYGLILPAFYFLSVRRTSRLDQWNLGDGTNTRWTIGIGVVCMTWLAWRIIASLSAEHRWKILFRPRLLDRALLFAATALCLWFHFKTMGGYDDTKGLFMGLIYPQSCFAGATALFALGLAEVFTQRRSIAREKNSRGALLASLGLMIVLFSPFLLSIPRVTHAQAMRLLQENRSTIVSAADSAKLDPALLAGIVYVAHTRDHPRWTGDVLEELSSPYREILDCSVGLMQMKESTASSLQEIIRNSSPNSPVSRPDFIRDYGCFQLVKYSQNLHQPDHSANLAACMLRMLCEQWRLAGYPIDDRPEILATLYNLGGEKSHPKPNPRPNDFGRRVGKFMQSEECRELFAAKPEAPE